MTNNLCSFLTCTKFCSLAYEENKNPTWTGKCQINQILGKAEDTRSDRQRELENGEREQKNTRKFTFVALTAPSLCVHYVRMLNLLSLTGVPEHWTLERTKQAL